MGDSGADNDNDRGDNTPSSPGGSRPDAGNPSHTGGEYGGWSSGYTSSMGIGVAAKSGAKAAANAASRASSSAWDSMLSRLSSAATNPKNIGKAIGFLVGGPVYGAITAPIGGWIANSLWGDPKAPSTRTQTKSLAASQAPSWGGMFSGKAVSPEREMSQGSEAAYQSWHSKQAQRATQQAAWTSYLAQLSGKKPVTSSDTEYGGLLS